MTLPCGLGGQVKLRWGCVEGRGWVQGGLPVQGSVWGVSPARAPTSSLDILLSPGPSRERDPCTP